MFVEGYPNRHLAAMHHLDATALANPLSESFAIRLVDAMMQIPIGAMRVDGIAYTPVPGEPGLLVDPAYPPRLADAMFGVLADPDPARRMGAAGRARVCNHFSWGSSARTSLCAFSAVRERGARARA